MPTTRPSRPALAAAVIVLLLALPACSGRDNADLPNVEQKLTDRYQSSLTGPASGGMSGGPWSDHNEPGRMMAFDSFVSSGEPPDFQGSSYALPRLAGNQWELAVDPEATLKVLSGNLDDYNICQVAFGVVSAATGAQVRTLLVASGNEQPGSEYDLQ